MMFHLQKEELVLLPEVLDFKVIVPWNKILYYILLDEFLKNNTYSPNQSAHQEFWTTMSDEILFGIY